ESQNFGHAARKGIEGTCGVDAGIGRPGAQRRVGPAIKRYVGHDTLNQPLAVLITVIAAVRHVTLLGPACSRLSCSDIVAQMNASGYPRHGSASIFRFLVLEAAQFLDIA